MSKYISELVKNKVAKVAQEHGDYLIDPNKFCLKALLECIAEIHGPEVSNSCRSVIGLIYKLDIPLESIFRERRKYIEANKDLYENIKLLLDEKETVVRKEMI